MTDMPNEISVNADIQDLAARAAELEQKLRDVELDAERRIRMTELKAEAVRAGIIDLDGLKLLDAAAYSSPDSPMDHAKVIGQLKRDKPWLFRSTSSSSTAEAPAIATPKRKLATEMSFEEWRLARAELLRRR